MRRKVATWLILTACFSFSVWSSAIGSNAPKVVKITAKKFDFTPSAITVKKGVPVILQFTSEDRAHGFSAPGLNLRTDITPGKAAEVSFTPSKTGEFNFFCDVFCGAGHDSMEGKITVVE
jgi:cytochrome c oxidase subunit 2